MLCWIKQPPSHITVLPQMAPYIGTQCTLIRYVGRAEDLTTYVIRAWGVELHDGNKARIAEAFLEPVNDDGCYRKSSWSECQWKPRDLKVKETIRIEEEECPF
jgi:hypothetical protein